jgi:hypothetical protein
LRIPVKRWNGRANPNESDAEGEQCSLSAAAVHRLHALDLRRNGGRIDEPLQYDQAACG